MPEPRTSLLRFLFSRPVEAVGALGLVAALLLPTGGLGVPMCAFKIITGAPCPGCGLTRSVTHAAHGSLMDALAFHPFGPVVFLGFAVLAFALVLPRSLHDRVLDRLDPAERGLKIAFWLGLGFVVVYGMARLAAWWFWGWRPPVSL